MISYAQMYKRTDGLKYISRRGNYSALCPPPQVLSRAPIHFLRPCFNSWLSNYQ